MGILSKIVGIPLIAKTVLKVYKRRAFKPFQIPLDKALDKQNLLFSRKMEKMATTNIGEDIVTLDLNEFASGVYILNIKNRDGLERNERVTIKK